MNKITGIIICNYLATMFSNNLLNFFLNTTIFNLVGSISYEKVYVPHELTHTLRSVSDPGARPNWLSLPRRDLMKVWDSVTSISPALLISNLAQVLGKN